MIQPGILVKSKDGYFGIVLSQAGDKGSGVWIVFEGNGLRAIEKAADLVVLNLPASTAPQAFYELFPNLPWEDISIPMVLHCPECHVQHVDVDDETGNWATTRHHHKHLCKPTDGGCGNVWQPALVNTVGVTVLPQPL